jgi:ring-1,2-phenylacetyl-CoA epoxidase subunit PaaC
MAVSNEHLFAALLQLADDHLILGHRVSEWCGHAPMLEEDLALSNLALDLLGQARALYAYAARLKARAAMRTSWPSCGLSATTATCCWWSGPMAISPIPVLRQFYFAAFMKPYWDWIAVNSTDETLRGIAGKAAKEMAYHVRHCGEWVIRLGDGQRKVRRGCGQPSRRCIATRQSCSRIRPPLGFAWRLAFCLPATA